MFIPVFYIITIYFTITSSRIVKREKYDPRTFSSCFENIGCVDFTEKWYDKIYRPKNLEPLDRHTIRTEFLLMKNPKNETTELVYDIMNLKKETVTVAGFRSGTCSIFVIHDFTSNGYTGWIKHLVVAVSRKTDCNVISIDWEAGAEPPFEQAIANARVVALEAKAFITLLKTCFNQSLDAIHLIGHGVGAHIAGYIGKHILGIQRITGLDPTGPFFERMPKEVRLDVGDAKYVEVIHTDSFNHRSQGGKIALGHADFIINNAGHQPGCNDSSHMPAFTNIHRDTLQEGKILAACSHKRAFKYYIQALEDSECQFIGLKCASYKNFLEGKCNSCGMMNKERKYNDCATFGLEEASVTTKNNTFYLLTFGKKPFCMHTYSVNVTINHSDSNKESEGYFEFILVDEADKVTNASSGNMEHIQGKKFVSGHSYSFIIYALPPHVDKIKEAKVKWNFKSKKICIMCDKAIAVRDISIKRISLSIPDLPSNLICPVHPNSELKNGDYVQFQTCESMYGPDYEKNGHVKPALKSGPKKGSNKDMKGNKNELDETNTSNKTNGSTNATSEGSNESNDALSPKEYVGNSTSGGSSAAAFGSSGNLTFSSSSTNKSTCANTRDVNEPLNILAELDLPESKKYIRNDRDEQKSNPAKTNSNSSNTSSNQTSSSSNETAIGSNTTTLSNGETTTLSAEVKECMKTNGDVKQFKDCFDSDAFRTTPSDECSVGDTTTTKKTTNVEN